jgi:phosphoribosylformylglycinamidine synthase subunit PurQ / glutaminase
VTARVAVVLFPGSNCEHDVAEAVRAAGGEAELVWHRATSLSGFDVVVLPGGFAHGDYLRAGAIARFSPVMAAVCELASAGGPVIGICNGFQVLTEAHLLPGALQRNAGLRFICAPSEIKVVSSRSVLTRDLAPGRTLQIPINHYEGNYTCDERTLSALIEGDQIVLSYSENPNGSVADIAGVCNGAGNVVGLMPHPERASNALSGSEDGRLLIQSLLGTVSTQAAGAA